MPYEITILGGPWNLTKDQVEINYENTFSMLARRVGVKPEEIPTGGKPEKFLDEPIAEPLKKFNIPVEVQTVANNAARKSAFSPEWIANLQRLQYNANPPHLTVFANSLNYGSVVGMRAVAKQFSEDIVAAISQEANPLGIIGGLVSEKNQTIYDGRRSKSVLIGEKWMPFPGEIIHIGDHPFKATTTGALEENNMVLAESSIRMIGATWSRFDAAGSNLNFIIPTSWTFQQVKDNMNKENDGVYPVPLDERSVKTYLKGRVERGEEVDSGLAWFIQAGETLFGSKWKRDLTEELKPMVRVGELMSTEN